MADSVERTALNPFNVGGMPVAKGRRVKLTRAQFSAAVAAGTVHDDDDLDAEVPVVSADVDHEALDAAAGNAAHNGTGQIQPLGDAEAARAQAEAVEVERTRLADLALQAEIDVAARRQAELDAEKARAATEGRTAGSGAITTAKSNVPVTPSPPGASKA